MGCCSPFSAATTRLTADPSRHVNFTAGMVLGVDDYAQEFAYHSERDKWMMREIAGYGTLSGLAVTVEADGANGARVRVAPGAAATPSGQLICVGREQCGSLNPWLARPEVVEELRKRTEHSATPAAATLNLFLTLCYVDCAVAEVPIPGEPCRSDENLMAPSRIADDYCLDLRFELPPMREAQAIDALAAFWATLKFDLAAQHTQAALDEALRRAELQLRLALDPDPDAPPPAPGDLVPITLNPGASARFGSLVKHLWVTRLLPLVSAQRCGAEAVAANDCVLLGRLTVPVVKPGTHWVVKGPPAGKPLSVELDESDRPLLLAANVSQTVVGSAMESDGRGRKIAFMPGGGPVPISSGLVIICSATAAVVGLPAPGPATLGKKLTVRAAGAGVVTVAAPQRGPATIDGAKTFKLAARGAVSLVSDGNQTWHVTGQVH